MKHIGFLAILFVVLLGAVIVKETSRPDLGSLRDQLPQQALSAKPWKPEDASRVVVKGPGKSDAFSLRKTSDGVWIVEDPFSAPATATVVEQFVTAVNEARGELRLDDAAALAKFDLTDARATRVTIEDAAGLTLVDFALGKSSGQQGAFVRPLFEGVRDGAYAVSQDLRGGLGLARTQPGATETAQPTPSHFHDLSLPPLAVGDPMRVSLTTPNWRIGFEKRGPAWMATEGAPNAPMRGQGVDQLVRGYGGAMTATSLADPARLGELGLAADTATYVATVTHLDEQVRTAYGAEQDGKYYVHFKSDVEPQVVYELAKYAFDRMFPRGGTLFEFPPVDADQLTTLSVTRGGDDFALTREGPSDDWTIVSPAWPLTPAATQLRSVGSVLGSVRAVDWYAGAAAFTEHAVITFAKKDEAPATLRIGQDAPGGDGKLAKLPGSEDVVVIATSAVERLTPTRLSLFEPRPLGDATVDDVTSAVVRDIVLTDGSKTDLFELTRGENGWTVAVSGESHAGADIPIELWLDAVLGVEVTTRSDYTGPFTREAEIRREGQEPVVIAFGTGSEELGTAVRIGDVTFFADVATAVGAVDPSALVRAEAPEAPEKEESPDSE